MQVGKKINMKIRTPLHIRLGLAGGPKGARYSQGRGAP